MYWPPGLINSFCYPRCVVFVCLSTKPVCIFSGVGHVKSFVAELHVSEPFPLNPTLLWNIGVCLRFCFRTVSRGYRGHFNKYTKVGASCLSLDRICAAMRAFKLSALSLQGKPAKQAFHLQEIIAGSDLWWAFRKHYVYSVSSCERHQWTTGIMHQIWFVFAQYRHGGEMSMCG